jgi:hypothetical protein
MLLFAHYATDYEQLSDETTKLHWLVLEMRSQMGGILLPLIHPTVQMKTRLLLLL